MLLIFVFLFIYAGHKELVDSLIKNGTDVIAKNVNDQTALDVSFANGIVIFKITLIRIL